MVAAGVCANLNREKFDPMVLFMHKSTGKMPEMLDTMGVNSHGLDLTRFSFLLRPLIVASVLNRLKIDILHVHHVAFYRQVAAGVRLSRVKYVLVTEHSKYNIVKYSHLQDACRKAAAAAAFFTVVSEELKEYFVRQLHIPEQSIEIIKNGVDTKRFEPKNGKTKLRRIIPASFDGKILMCVGRLTEAKDHCTLLLAMKRLVEKNIDAYLVLIGEGELREDIESQINELGLHRNVRLLGNRTDVNELMPCADVFVLSSRHEGLPMVLLEAMSCGIPVVASKVGGIPEIVRNGVNGFLVPSENPSVLADQLECMLTVENAREMGRVGREMVARDFSMVKTANQYARLYEKAMSRIAITKET